MSSHKSNIVVVAIITRASKIFIAKRAKTKVIFPDIYELPGGHVEPGETLEEALVREIGEELGVKIKVGPLLDAFTHTYKSEFKVELGYICYLDDENAEPQLDPADHSESQWITELEIAKFDKEDDETAMLRKAFTFLKGEKYER